MRKGKHSEAQIIAALKQVEGAARSRIWHARLKKLVADFSLDKDMLQSVIRKNSLGS